MKNTYNVLLEIGEFRNRGDFMMMETACEQVRRRLPGANLAVPFRLFREQSGWCLAHRLIPLARMPQHLGRRLRLRLDRFVTRHVLRRTSFLLPDEIDLVLYATGYRYADHFVRYYTEASTSAEEAYMASFTKRGRKFVLMPQAFGPFKTAVAREKMLGLYRHVDLVFARERKSYEHLLAIVPEAKNVFRSPDFTCLCEPVTDTVRLPKKDYVVFIPNQRMVTHTPEAISGAYVSFCEKMLAAFLERGERVVLMNHQEGDDEAIVAELEAKFAGRLTVVARLTGSGCKDVIANAKLVVSSRFHGAVSGLVTGVPTFCTSWSHKYGELMAEHGRPGNVLDVLKPEDAAARIVDALDHPESYRSAPGCAQSIRIQAAEMWERIFSLVPERARSAVPAHNALSSKLWK